MSNHRFDLKQTTRYEYGPYIIESHLIDTWQYRKYNKPHDWSRPHKSVMDCMNEIDKYETQLEHENATEQDIYERVNRHQVANEPASVPEQERYDPQEIRKHNALLDKLMTDSERQSIKGSQDYVTSPPPMDTYPTKFKAPKLEDGEHYARYFERVMQSVEDYINERWS